MNHPKPESYKIKNYKWYGDYLHTYTGVNLKGKSLKQLPFKFGIIDGSFNISNNNLKNLYGCPTEIHGDLRAEYNAISNINDIPEYIRGDFDLSSNLIEWSIIMTMFKSGHNVEEDLYLSYNPVIYENIPKYEWVKLYDYVGGNIFTKYNDSKTYEVNVKEYGVKI